MFIEASERSVQQPHAYSESPRCSKPPQQPPPLPRSPRSPTVTSHKVQELRVIFTTCTPCSGCSHHLYDEEVMAEWVAAGNPPHTGLSCSNCHRPIVPRLTVRIIAILESTTAPLSHGLIEQSMPFLSPLVLRRQLEAVFTNGVENMGTRTLSSAGLLAHRKGRVLLWNLVYLLHRAGMPTHLLDAFPAWLMDAQEEARRLGGGRRVLLGGSLTIARALSVSNIF